MLHQTNKTLKIKMNYPKKSQLIKQTFLMWLLRFLFPHKSQGFFPPPICELLQIQAKLIRHYKGALFPLLLPLHTY